MNTIDISCLFLLFSDRLQNKVYFKLFYFIHIILYYTPFIYFGVVEVELTNIVSCSASFDISSGSNPNNDC